MFGFAGVGFLGAVDAVGGVETGAEQFLLALAAATSAGLDQIGQIDGEFFLFLVFHDLAVYYFDEVFGEDDVLVVDGVGKERSHLRDGKAGDAASDGGDEEFQVAVLTGKGDKLVHIGLDDVNAAMHRGNGVTLPLQADTLAPYGAKTLKGDTCCATAMISGQIAAKDKYLVLAQTVDPLWCKFSVVHNRQLFI